VTGEAVAGAANPAGLWVVLPAAGRATRFGAADDLPKQYRQLAGRSVLEWSLAAMRALRPRAIVLAVAADDVRWRALPARLLEGVEVVLGGDDRASSVANGLAAIASRAAPDDWALVHDVARPCVEVGDCRRLLAAVATHPVGGLLAVPVPDTVKRGAAPMLDDGTAAVDATLPREGLWLAQTPQVFRHGRLVAALAAARAAGVAVTDEASAIEFAGAQPLLVRGSQDNFKLTWAEDLARAAAVLGRRARQVVPA
jgi:2-C-methyl-D-erythritol 4-phosphate cytidylyltransferase